MGGIDDKNAGGWGIFTNLKRDEEGWRAEKDGGGGREEEGEEWRLEKDGGVRKESYGEDT